MIYGRKFGMALTMDVFTPKAKRQRRRGDLAVKRRLVLDPRRASTSTFSRSCSSRGYTVFAVMHGSQPKFTIPEAIADMNLSVRYIRAHAGRVQASTPTASASRGGSAGGHLSLMLGTAGDAGDPNAKDPVARTSSRVQAVACFFPPTDFLNYGTPGYAWLNRGPKDAFKAPFDFHEWNPELKVIRRRSTTRRASKIGREISPVYHVTKDDPPTLIIHGDKDALVPLATVGADHRASSRRPACPASWSSRRARPTAGPSWHDDMRTIADWFDKYLKPASN